MNVSQILLHQHRIAKADRLLNDASAAPNESMQGFTLLNPHLALLDIGNTIIRRDYADIDQVKLLSGGCSGHEPLHSGYVGNGFLTAAVHGELFSAPSAYHIYNVIKELAYQQDNGILIIIQNNSGDTLNFGLAAEKALNEGIKVKVLIVSDDCSGSELFSNSKASDQPQGLSGVIMVQKIAAAMAEEKESSYLEIYKYCDELQRDLATVMVTMRASTAPDEDECVCVKNTKTYEVEFGGGLHGEGGSKIMVLTTTKAIVAEMLNELRKKLVLDDASEFVLMVNNMCVSRLEESVFLAEVVKSFLNNNVKIVRIYSGSFMSSMNMKALSLTILKCDELRLKYLDYPTDAPEWRIGRLVGMLEMPIKPRVKVLRNPRLANKGPKLIPRESNVLLLVLQFACDALISCERQLNIIDGECGDGDTGTRMKVVCEDILDGLRFKQIDLENVYVFFKTLSRIAERIGASLGAIYAILFEAAANTVGQLEVGSPMEPPTWISCLSNAVSALKSHTKTVDATNNMLVPLVACLMTVEEALEQQEEPANRVLEAFGIGVAAAEEAAQRTRSTNRKFPDSGAHAVGIWMRACFEGVKLRCEY